MFLHLLKDSLYLKLILDRNKTRKLPYMYIYDNSR